MNASSPTSPSRLPLLAALCIGIAIGALVISALQSQPRTAPIELRPEAPDGGQIERMVASIEVQTKAQAGTLIRLESLMQELLARSHAVPATSDGARMPIVEPIKPMSERVETDRRKGDAASWLAARDEDIVQLLVERGLTPYDSGVAVHVTTAAVALHQTTIEHNTTIAPLVSDLQNGLLSSQDYHELQSHLGKERAAKRKQVLDQLEAALDALSKGSAAGE